MMIMALAIYQGVNGRERWSNDDYNPMRYWEKKTTKHAQQSLGKGLAWQFAQWCIKGDASCYYE